MGLTEQIRKCHECPLGRGRVCQSGGLPRGIMVVKAAPSWEEDREGMLFVDQAGQFLQTCLGKVGVSLNDVYFTALVRHYPGKGQEVPAYAIEACHHWLVEEYTQVQPALIVAVGAIVMRSLGVKGGININAGSVFTTDLWGPVLPVLDPAGLMRPQGIANTPKFLTQLNRIKSFMRGEELPPPYVRCE